MFNIKDFVLILLIICIIYLFYKTNKIPENFSTISNDIKTAVNDKYKVDMDAIRNLASFSKSLTDNNSTLTIPANNTIVKDLTVEKNLIVKGNINFTNKDGSAILEIFPKYMIIAYGKSTPPNGWAICDNKFYKLVNNVAVEVPDGSYPSIQTPDLRGRIIVGTGPITGQTKNRNFATSGGVEGFYAGDDNMPPFLVLLYIMKI